MLLDMYNRISAFRCERAHHRVYIPSGRATYPIICWRSVVESFVDPSKRETNRIIRISPRKVLCWLCRSIIVSISTIARTPIRPTTKTMAVLLKFVFLSEISFTNDSSDASVHVKLLAAWRPSYHRHITVEPREGGRWHLIERPTRSPR